MTYHKNNILTVLFTGLLLAYSAYRLFKMIPVFKLLDANHKYLFFALLLIFILTLVLAVWKGRILITNRKNIILIYPFQFRYRIIAKSHISKLSWDNMKLLVLDFRYMVVRMRSGKKLILSDLEFNKLSKIEKEFMKMVHVERNVRHDKEDISYNQAMFNKPVIDVALILFVAMLVGLVAMMVMVQSVKIIILMVSDLIILLRLKVLRDYYREAIKHFMRERFIESSDW